MLRKILLALLFGVAAVLVLPPAWYVLFPEPTPELPPAGRRVEVAPGVGVNLLDEGSGPPLVLVHGHPGSAYDWARLMDALVARGHRVLAYDRVGYGRSDARADGDFTVGANAAELNALLAAEGLRDVGVVGWSYGGATAIVAARQDPSRMARVVLVGSVGPGIEDRPGPPAALVTLVARPALAWLRGVPPLSRRAQAGFLELAFAPEAMPEGSRSVVAANFARPHTFTTAGSEGRDLGGTADLDPAPIEVPILVIHGDGDRLVPFSVAETLHRRAPRSELWRVEGGGHALPVTRPAALADRIAAFVREDTAPR